MLKKYSVGLLLVLEAILCAVFTFITAAAETPKKIRVGYFDFPSLQNTDASGNHSGYIYDYLQEIAKYTGWEYEYFTVTFEEAMEMLKNGELDILGGVQYTDKRAEEYAYPIYPCGMANTALFARSTDTRYAYGDTESFNGMKVGLLKSSSSNNDFFEYCKDKNFHVSEKYYDTEPEMVDALNAGAVDAICSPSFSHRAEMRSIAGFDYENFYLISTLGNDDFIEELDGALEKIKVIDPYFEMKLSERYFSTSESEVPIFTKDELAFIADAGVFTVAYNKNWIPMERYNEQTNSFDGVMADIFQMISKSTGLRFEYVAQNSYDQAYNALLSGNVNMLCSTASNYSWAEEHNMKLSREYLDAPVVMVRDTQKKHDKTVVAMPQGLYLTREIASDYPAYEIKQYENYPQCFDAIINGEANCTFANSYLAAEYIGEPRYSKMSAVVLNGFSARYCVGFHKDVDRRLVSVVDKALSCISNSTITKLLLNDTMKYKSISPMDLIYQNPLESIFALAVVFAVFIILLLIILGNKSRYAKNLFSLLYIDDLTGAWSLNKFRIEADKLLKKSRGISRALLYLDVNKFKFINDTYGYTAGDAILKHICTVCMKKLDRGELFARLHSDQFTAILSYTDQTELDNKVNDIIDALSEPFLFGENKIHAIFLAGIYQIQAGDSDVNAAIDRANYAKEQCQIGHKSTFVYYNEEFRRALKAEKALENDMENALANGDFKVYYQPKVHSTEDAIVGAEALVRWNHPERGLIPPFSFITLFEKNGFITQIDYFVFEQTCIMLEKWSKAGKTLLPLSCNFSRLHLFNNNFAAELADIADRHGVEHSLLEIEITETMAIDNIQMVRKHLAKLKEYGFEIAIDDFGAGYSSLGILSGMPIDVIKLDKSFITNASVSEQDRRILSGIVDIFNSLGKKMVCEGVETKEQKDLLEAINCRVIQGYYYSKPLPADDFCKFAEHYKDKIIISQ